MSPDKGRQRSTAPEANVVELVTSPTWIKAHGPPRDPDKYTWLENEFPHVPRREQISATQTALTLLVGVIALALVAATTFLWPIFLYWVTRG